MKIAASNEVTDFKIFINLIEHRNINLKFYLYVILILFNIKNKKYFCREIAL